MKPTIFLDMDGVITDLVGSMEDRLGKPNFKVERWGIHECYGMTVKEYWSKFQDKLFWSDMKAYEGWQEFYYKLREYSDNVIFLSTPTWSSASASGKVEWLQSYFGKGFRDYILTSEKHLLARPDRILIDDSDKNCEMWERNNGDSILVPRAWNKNKKFEDTIGSYEHVSNILEEYYGHVKL